MAKEFITYQVKCSRCRNKVESHFPGRADRPLYCKLCIQLMGKVSMLQSKLLKEELLLEQDDTQVAEQINALLVKESVDVSKENEDLLNSLVERLVSDEKRRKNLLRQIRKLQNQKR